MHRLLQEVKLGTGQQFIEKAYREAAGYGLTISESQLAELLGNDFQSIEFLTEWLAGEQPHFLMDVVATILLGRVWPQTKTSEEDELRLFCEEFAGACESRGMQFSYDPEDEGVAKALLGLSRGCIEDLAEGVKGRIGMQLQEPEVVAILQNISPDVLRGLKKDQKASLRTIEMFIEGLSELVERNEATKVGDLDDLNHPDKWLKTNYLSDLCRDLFPRRRQKEGGQLSLVEDRPVANSLMDEDAAMEANLDVVDAIFDDPALAAIETIQKVVLNVGSGDGYIEDEDGRYEVMPDTTLALLGVAAGYCIGSPLKDGNAVRQIRMANLLTMIETGYAAAKNSRGNFEDVSSLVGDSQAEKEHRMNDDQLGAKKVIFKYPMAEGVTVDNMPPQMKERMDAVVEQATRAIEDAGDLGEALIQSLGGFLVENGFSIKSGNQQAITPEVIVVLLGLAAGYVAAMDNSAEALSDNPGFADTVELAYRQNLMEMFDCGKRAASRKLQGQQEEHPEIEEAADEKGGDLVQFPVDRIVKKPTGEE